MLINRRGHALLLAVVGILVVCGLAIAGCGGGSSSTEASSSGSESGEAAETGEAAEGEESGEAAGGEESSEPLTVAYIPFSLTIKPQQELKKGMEEQAKKYGYTLKVVDGGGEPAKAIAAMQTVITQGVDAIVLDSYGEDQIKAGLLAAKSAEIPVYMAYAPGEMPETAVAVRGNAGAASAEKLVEEMGETGSVLALTVPSGPNCVSSQEQFEEIVEEHPGITVREQPVKIPGYQQEAATATTGWLKSQNSGEKIAIWGCFDAPAVAAASAVNEAGMAGEVAIYGQNTEAATVNLLEKKQYTASWYFDSIAFGRKMIELVHGNAGTAYSELEAQFTTFPGIEVNQQNVKKFVKEFPQVLG